MREIRGRLRRAEVWERWLELAAENGLHAGNIADLDAAGFEAGASDWTVYYRAEVEQVLDAMLAQARARRPRYSVQALPDGRAAIVVDPDGLASNWTSAAAELRYLAVVLHQARVVQDSVTSGVSLARVAGRWRVKPRTLKRWRSKAGVRGVKKAERMAPAAPESGCTVAA